MRRVDTLSANVEVCLDCGGRTRPLEVRPKEATARRVCRERLVQPPLDGQ